MSKRSCATLVLITTHSSSRLRKLTRRRPTCFQTNIITVGAERFHCTEVPFQPSFTGKEASGFRDTSFQNVMKCDVNIRKILYANAVLSSGTIMSQWIFEHMTKELTAVAPSTLKLICEGTLYGLEDLPCLSSSFSSEVDLEGRVR